MQKLTDPSPYEILGVSPNADKPTISKAYTKALRNPELQKHQVQVAFHALMRPESRLLIDAFTLPDRSNEIDFETVNRLIDFDEQEVEWSNYLDFEEIFHQDLMSLTDKVVRSLFEDVVAPKIKPSLSFDFDGLDAFIEKWLE